ncbi:MAG TPA: DUF108 domain-containing protein [Candidatus Omnitrophota bacterium]|nr:DUF108 domain-containing protein [Candidatus Omnitrophota bacterium]
MKKRLRIGIVGCGAIGSRLAKTLPKDLKNDYMLSGLFDILPQKAFALSKYFSNKKIIKSSLKDLIQSCDIVVEAINTNHAREIVQESLKAKKHVLTVSVGQLLNAQNLFKLAKKQGCKILIPSGAIAGIDAIKAGQLVPFQKITQITRKPITGFKNDPYLAKKGINLSKIKKETVIFQGSVDQAVKAFPRNINVSATLSLACQHKNKVLVKIITSPKYKENSHEIEMIGAFGRINTKTVNVICPDNPKTSYLAVLSVIQTLKQFSSGVFVGT